MLLRAGLLYVLFVLLLLAGSFAIWQSLELTVRDRSLSANTHALTAARRDLSLANARTQAADRRARIAEQDASHVQQSSGASASIMEDLKSNLAAAVQQLSASETAITETEQRLTDEISAHAALRHEADAMRQSLEQLKRSAEAAEANAAAALQVQSRVQPVVSPSVPPATALVPQSSLAPVIGDAGGSAHQSGLTDRAGSGPAKLNRAASQKTVKKVEPKRGSKKPAKVQGSNVFEPFF